MVASCYNRTSVVFGKVQIFQEETVLIVCTCSSKVQVPNPPTPCWNPPNISCLFITLQMLQYLAVCWHGKTLKVWLWFHAFFLAHVHAVHSISLKKKEEISIHLASKLSVSDDDSDFIDLKSSFLHSCSLPLVLYWYVVYWCYLCTDLLPQFSSHVTGLILFLTSILT